MKKSLFYIILSFLSLIFLFSFAALCNQCGTATTEEKIDVTETEEAEETEAETAEETETEEEAEEIDEEDAEEEEPAEDEEEEESTEEKTAPTITLEAYEGPTYSSADGVCFYRIQAKVTGSPTPSVAFSKDDSEGAWGSKKTQVNLDSPDDSYTLTATATNSEGSATASMTLTWGCSEDEEEEEAEEDEVTITADTGRSGYISGSSASVDGTNLVYVGDNGSNQPVKGYLSFDISDISDLDDVTITDADILIGGVEDIGEPWVAGGSMDIKVFYYGSNLDYPDDFEVGGVLVKTFSTSSTLDDLDFSTSELKSELQKAVNDDKSFFQLKFGLSGVSNNAYSDVYKFLPSNCRIVIAYETTG